MFEHATRSTANSTNFGHRYVKSKPFRRNEVKTYDNLARAGVSLLQIVRQTGSLIKI